MQVDSFKEPDLLQRMSEAKLSLPSMVKPQVACGVANAHKMGWLYLVSFWVYVLLIKISNSLSLSLIWRERRRSHRLSRPIALDFHISRHIKDRRGKAKVKQYGLARDESIPSCIVL